MNRPKDLIDFIEQMAAQSGYIEAVDENYYQAFLQLSQQQVEKLAVAVMLDQEREVRRLAGGKTDADTVARVAGFIQKVFWTISIGLARFDAFGGLDLFPALALTRNRIRMKHWIDGTRRSRPLLRTSSAVLCLGFFPVRSAKANCRYEINQMEAKAEL